jgi:hypothetical protein
MGEDRDKTSGPLGLADQEPTGRADAAQCRRRSPCRFEVIVEKRSVEVAFAVIICNILLFGEAFREFRVKMFADSSISNVGISSTEIQKENKCCDGSN